MDCFAAISDCCFKNNSMGTCSAALRCQIKGGQFKDPINSSESFAKRVVPKELKLSSVGISLFQGPLFPQLQLEKGRGSLSPI